MRSEIIHGPRVGIIANPVSARDIRRIVANASNLQTTERVNIVLRLLSTLAAVGVGEVLMMPDKSGMRSMIERRLDHGRPRGHGFPALEFIDMSVTSTVDDTVRATRRMQQVGVSAIIVLGGDGTHRAVVQELLRGIRTGASPIPIAGISTGTNNAFPEMREPTLVALAVGMYAVGKISAQSALSKNKVLEVTVDDHQREIALVDVVIANSRFVGARALWKPETLDAAYLAFAEPNVIGLSAIGGLLSPVRRTDPGGLAVHLAHEPADSAFRLKVPIAPGMLCEIGIRGWEFMRANDPFTVAQNAGVVALDGERELTFDAGETVRVAVREDAFETVDVDRCLYAAASAGTFRSSNVKH